METIEFIHTEPFYDRALSLVVSLTLFSRSGAGYFQGIGQGEPLPIVPTASSASICELEQVI